MKHFVRMIILVGCTIWVPNLIATTMYESNEPLIGSGKTPLPEQKYHSLNISRLSIRFDLSKDSMKVIVTRNETPRFLDIRKTEIKNGVFNFDLVDSDNAILGPNQTQASVRLLVNTALNDEGNVKLDYSDLDDNSELYKFLVEDESAAENSLDGLYIDPNNVGKLLRDYFRINTQRRIKKLTLRDTSASRGQKLEIDLENQTAVLKMAFSNTTGGPVQYEFKFARQQPIRLNYFVSDIDLKLDRVNKSGKRTGQSIEVSFPLDNHRRHHVRTLKASKQLTDDIYSLNEGNLLNMTNQNWLAGGLGPLLGQGLNSCPDSLNWKKSLDD